MLKSIVEDRLTICLYSNAYTPDKDSSTDSFVEVEGGGYSKKLLESSNWKIIKEEKVRIEHPEVTWKFQTTVGQVYGYYVKDINNQLVWAERFVNGPYDIDTFGDSIAVTPSLTIRQGQ